MDVLNIIIGVVKVILSNFETFIAAMVGLMSFLVLVFLAIPGEHPEKEFKAFADFLSKFSKKPKGE